MNVVTVDAVLNGVAPKGNHGTYYRYKFGCRCAHCTEANKQRGAGTLPMKPVGRNDAIPASQVAAPTWIILNFPVALVARQAFPDDREAIAAAFGEPS